MLHHRLRGSGPVAPSLSTEADVYVLQTLRTHSVPKVWTSGGLGTTPVRPNQLQSNV